MHQKQVFQEARHCWASSVFCLPSRGNGDAIANGSASAGSRRDGQIGLQHGLFHAFDRFLFRAAAFLLAPKISKD
ncbi:hypothetical protein QTL95_25700 [Rhizobium sp. S152]|uniref:hypothetical protein n=1 Tax=Rhizobium sp. S152 TaxID=3055038 RepID=UPI0025A9C0C5|nr:hypothetical protein [Rhizobium sp. S152]MDM9629291.1 hypothetical protein [Rhizobium sp. S152]